MSSSISILESSDPEVTLQQCLDAFQTGEDESHALAFTFSARQDYLPGAPAIKLLALVALQRRHSNETRLGFSIMEPHAELLGALSTLTPDWSAAEQWCQRHDQIWLDSEQPIALKPVHIPKPWGQEIWYTGIEERGQSRIADEQGRAVPLPWLLALCPNRVLGSAGGELVLLKVLDPLPEPVFGDLYFEMHEEKREVYVVTHVDESAWPDGRGGIRFGFNQNKRREIGGDMAFKREYLAAVQAYRAIRVEIDQILDQRRAAEGVELDAPLDPQTSKTWLAGLPQDLLQKEGELRARMEAFIHVDPLKVGDVVKVPCYTPHSLLHGVRTVEFQTPVYERKILSFAQKVLTQSHWDTEEALDLVTLDAPETAQLPLVQVEEGCRIEEVVDFEDFRVERITLSAGTDFDVVAGQRYALLMAVTGGVLLNGKPMEAEQAMLLAANHKTQRVNFRGVGDGVVLLARPKQRLSL